MPEFTKLFKPGRIGKLELKNRIIFPPLITFYATGEGHVSERQIDYYAERARGGAGLVVVESSYPRSGGYMGRIHLYDDKFIPGLRRLVEAIHAGGAKAVCQVNTHRGRADDHDPASPSGLPHPFTGVKSRVITVADIKKLIMEFGEGVRRVKEAGFDGIMIHGASGYLVAEFLSPLINRRTDQYGGDPEKRARFALELVEMARRKVGHDYPVICRLTADERTAGGFTTKDGIALCKMLEEAGVDAVDIVTGNAETVEWVSPPMYLPPGCNGDVSEAIKKEIRIPVSVAGKINDPYLAEKMLRDGKADFVCIGRGLLADPQFPNKAREGRIEDICKCIACMKCFDATIVTHTPVECSVNPVAGNEREFELKLRPAEKKKRVLVIGGGPAGTKAALIAAQKVHDVTLWEASDRLGGQLNLAIIPPGKEDIKSFLEYLKTQVMKSTVKVEMNKRATAASVKEFAPDAVVIATGSTPFTPDIPGVKGENVVNHRKVLSGEKGVGDKVIVIGGGYVGCETAEFLAGKGKDLTVVFPEPEPILDVVCWAIRKLMLRKLEEKKIKILAGVKQFREITPKGIGFISKEGKEVFLEADNIILATGAIPEKSLIHSLRGEVPEIYEAGDCAEVRRILEAVHEGAKAALEI